MNFPVFDLHCDTALELLGRDMKTPKALRSNDLHIDLERAKSLPGYCQCFACFTTPYMLEWAKVTPEVVFQHEMDIILAELDRNRDLIEQAYSAEDVRRNLEKGKMSAILTIEGPAGFGFDPALLEDLYKVGFRISSLGWNEQNVLTGSHVTGGGLTDLGREYIKEAQRLGMIIDVSHISDEGFWDIMKVTNAPIVATHSNSRNICGNSRFAGILPRETAVFCVLTPVLNCERMWEKSGKKMGRQIVFSVIARVKNGRSTKQA